MSAQADLDFEDGVNLCIAGAKVMSKQSKDWNNDGKVKHSMTLGFIGGTRQVYFADSREAEAAPPVGARTDVIGQFVERKGDKGTATFLQNIRYLPEGTLDVLMTPENFAQAATRAAAPARSVPAQRAA